VINLVGCFRKEPEIPPEYACSCVSKPNEISVSVSQAGDSGLFGGLVLRSVAGKEILAVDTGVGTGLARRYFVPTDERIQSAELMRSDTLLASFDVVHSPGGGGCCEGVLFVDVAIPDSLGNIGGLRVRSEGGR